MSKTLSVRFAAGAVSIAVICSLAAISKGPAVADDEPSQSRGLRGRGGPSNFFSLIDANGDGKITKDEVIALHGKVDANKDGVITQDELLKHIGATSFGPQVDKRPSHGPAGRGRGGQPTAETLFTQFDRNKDGKIASGEVPTPVWNRLQAADADKNGAVTKAEFAKISATRRPSTGREQPSGVPLPELADKFFKQFDANKDGNLSKDEVPAQAWKRIVAADSDEDGVVTEAEFKTRARKSQEASKTDAKK